MKTFSDLRTAPDEELLQMYNDAQGDTDNFKKNFETEFSYTTLTNEIKKRGYVQGWMKQTNECINKSVKLQKKTKKMLVDVTPECQKRYSEFISNKQFPYLYTTEALEDLMTKINLNQMKIIVEA